MTDEIPTTSEMSNEERPPVLPFFIVMDVSLSMQYQNAIDHVNDSFHKLRDVVRAQGSIQEVSRIGVISFAETVKTEIGLTNLAFADLPKIGVRDAYTNFAPVLRDLRREIETSITSLGSGAEWHRPVVFFITDGGHNVGDDWQRPLADLKNSGKYTPNIISVGFNEAREAEIREICTSRYILIKKSPDLADQVTKIFKTLIGTVHRNSDRLAASSDMDAMHLTIETDDDDDVIVLPKNRND